LRRTPRRRVQPEPATNEPRVNYRIRVPRVLVIDEEGRKLGEFMTEDAVRLAEERGLDLIEVAPDGRPPVCRIQDYGKLKYERKKKDAQARKNQVQVQLKEVKLRPKTDDHDIAVKVRHARRFLEEGNKVKVTIRFRGRELAHRDIGSLQCMRMAKECEDLSTIETHPRMDGRQMFMILAPIKGLKPRIRRPSDDDDLPPMEDDDDDDDDDDLEDDEVGEGGEEVEDGEEAPAPEPGSEPVPDAPPADDEQPTA
jgi:translation initiation factor IF-3